MTEEILSRLDKIEYQLKFFADTYKHLHNTFIRGVHVSFEKNILEPNLSKLTNQMNCFSELIHKLNTITKENSVLGTLSFMAKQINDMKDALSEIKEHGIKKKIHIDFTADGYEMVKKRGDSNGDGIEEQMSPEDSVKKLLETITEREAEVIKHRYGLFGEKAKTLVKTGKILGISGGRIGQIQNRALRKMRHPCRRKFVSVLTHKELKDDILGE